MPARFCTDCGTPTLPEAKFCAQCGFALGPAGRPTAAARSWRPTALGGLVLGGFVLVGLGIWAAILTPDAPAPRPGGGAARASAGASPAAPEAPRELPGEITKLVGDLATRAEAKPDDLDLWTHLGEVYYRTSQFDPGFRPKALAAFDHVLERDAKRADAIRGKGNVYYDQQDAPKAIAHFERFLAIHPDDASVRTDLATMYLADGQHDRALALYRAVIADDPEFMQAHYNLAAALHGDGDTEGALAELRVARRLTKDESLQQRIDALIARLVGDDAPPPTPAGGAPSPPPPADDRTPFQTIVEDAFRRHEIMGPRIASIEWTGPGTTRVLMQSFPMDAMPPMVREKFETRLRDTLTDAAANHPVSGDRSVTLVDAESGRVMATVEP
jgi:cytochrome c-type biogenesis protein CcmH/NrfG